MIPSETRFVAQHIRPRPTSGVVMTFASGHQVGKSYGIDGPSFEIGNETACDVPVVDDSANDHPTGVASEARRLRVERGSSGWSIRDLNGIGFFVNQSYVRSTSELRSGDIVRLTWKGPDVQFLLQSSSQSLNRLVEQYLPAGDVDQRESESVVAASVMAAAVPDAPNEEASQPYSARDTRILPNANPQGFGSAKISAGESPKNSTSDLRKTTHLSHEALSAVHAFQENKRQSRLPMTWLIAVATLVIVVLLSALAYMIVGMG